MSFAALEVLERCPRDFIGPEIQDMLIEAGVKRSVDINTREIKAEESQTPSSPYIAASEAATNQSRNSRKWQQFWAKYFEY